MREIVYEYDDISELHELSAKCLVTGPICLYPEGQKPTSDEILMKAVWDTGSERTLVSKDILETLELEPIGMGIELHSITGAYKSDMYIIDLYLTEDVAIRNLIVGELPNNTNYSILIGIDAILRTDFSIEPKGNKVFLKVRHPSQKGGFTTKKVEKF